MSRFREAIIVHLPVDTLPANQCIGDSIETTRVGKNAGGRWLVQHRTVRKSPPFRHAIKPGLIIVPVHAGKEIDKGLIHSILKGGPEMTREYLVVYEKAEGNWSAFSPDVNGCGSLGDSLEETRSCIGEALALCLEDSMKAGERLPEATTFNINFRDFDPNHETKQYFFEWLAVPLPHPITQAA